jgi:hypothetical protein
MSGDLELKYDVMIAAAFSRIELFILWASMESVAQNHIPYTKLQRRGTFLRRLRG